MEPRNLQSGASPNPPTKLENPSVGYPQAGDPATATPASVGGPFWFYAMSEEMRNVIIRAGLTPSDDELDQFWQAIQIAAQPEIDQIGRSGVSTGSTIPAKCLIESGQELLRASYPEMWQWVQLQTNLIPQATKNANPVGLSGYYGDGDGATTFTLCNMNGLHTRSYDAGRGLTGGGLFSYQSDQIKAHSHVLNNHVAESAFLYSGGGGNPGVNVPTSSPSVTGSTGAAENTVKAVMRLHFVRVLP